MLRGKSRAELTIEWRRLQRALEQALPSERPALRREIDRVESEAHQLISEETDDER